MIPEVENQFRLFEFKGLAFKKSLTEREMDVDSTWPKQIRKVYKAFYFRE